MGAFTASTVTIAVLLMLAIVVTALVVRARRPAGAVAARPWVRTSGTVLSATVQVGTAGSTRSQLPLVFYAYQVDGEVFQGHRVRRTNGACNASTTIARYPAGSSVVVWYDPTDPANSALEL
jgi:Protein of unknown function (DUF3592)